MTELVAFSTCPDAASAAFIARALVEEGLAACVNQIPGVTSTFRWQDTLHEDAEVLLIIKTTEARYAELEARYTELHPYEAPEFIAWPITRGSAPYLEWLRQSVDSAR